MPTCNAQKVTDYGGYHVCLREPGHTGNHRCGSTYIAERECGHEWPQEAQTQGTISGRLNVPEPEMQNVRPRPALNFSVDIGRVHAERFAIAKGRLPASQAELADWLLEFESVLVEAFNKQTQMLVDYVAMTPGSIIIRERK